MTETSTPIILAPVDVICHPCPAVLSPVDVKITLALYPAVRAGKVITLALELLVWVDCGQNTTTPDCDAARTVLVFSAALIAGARAPGGGRVRGPSVPRDKVAAIYFEVVCNSDADIILRSTVNCSK